MVLGCDLGCGTGHGKQTCMRTVGCCVLMFPHSHVPTPAGGAPDPRSLTAGKFLTGVSGCVRGLVLAPAGTPRHPTDLRHGAVGGSAVVPCPS